MSQDVDLEGNCTRCGGIHYGSGRTCVFSPEYKPAPPWPKVEVAGNPEKQALAERVSVLERALREIDKVLCDNSEITDNNVVYWFNRYCPELDTAVISMRAALRAGETERNTL